MDDFEYDEYEQDDDGNYVGDDSGDRGMLKPIPTGTVGQFSHDVGRHDRYYLILGNYWWNCEQTFAYYMVRCDKEGNVLDGAEPEYHWCHGGFTALEQAEAA